MRFIKQFGLQRSGTNIAKALLEINFDGVHVLSNYLGNKHDPASWERMEEALVAQRPEEYGLTDEQRTEIEALVGGRKLPLVFNIKDPVSWTNSYYKYQRKKALHENHAIEFDFDEKFAFEALRRYEDVVSSWIDLIEQAEICCVFVHEEIVSGLDRERLNSIRSDLGLQPSKNFPQGRLMGYARRGVEAQHGKDLVNERMRFDRSYHLEGGWRLDVPKPVMEFLLEGQGAIFDRLGTLPALLLGQGTKGRETIRKPMVPAIGRSMPDELAMLRALASMLGEHDLVLDVGAGSGNHALYLAAESGCKVIAFEPDPELCDSLRKSILLNGLDGRVTLVCKGADAAADTEEVLSLDAMAFSQPVKAIMIDVGGTELDVLAGARSLIRRDQPALFVRAPTKSSLDQLSRLMGGWGYAYQDTFGVVPVHWFLPRAAVNQPEVVAGASGGEQPAEQDAGRLESESENLKAELVVARQKYRAVNELAATLKVQLAEANAKYREVNNRYSEVRRLLADKGQGEGGDGHSSDQSK